MKIDVCVHKGYSQKVFYELVNAAYLSFKELGHKSKIRKVETLDNIKSDICFVFGGFDFMKFKKNKSTKYILWQLEQIPRLGEKTNETESFRFNQFKEYAQYYDYIFDFNDKQTEFLRSKGFKAETLNIGYHPSFERIKKEPRKYKYDILFYGRYSKRRIDLLHALKRKHNVYYSMTLWGKGKIKKIKQSKICLNIHNDNNNSFEVARIIPDLISNRKFVLTESSESLYPFTNKEHLVSCPYKKIPENIEYYLTHENERDCIATNGYKFIRKNIKFIDQINKLLMIVKP